MNCKIPLNDDPKYFQAVSRIMVREDVRLWKGDGAVDAFDRQWRDDRPSINLHPELQRRIDGVIEAMRLGQTAPGLWQEYDGTCHQDWVSFACFARWFHAVDEETRTRALVELAQGNKEPWWPKGATGDEEATSDMPYACGGSTKTTCCPESVFTDEQYLEHDPPSGPTGSTGMVMFVVVASMIGAVFAVPKIMEKF
jgi:hypothetical protein